MKAGKALKVAGALSASLALLTVLAGCGQASSPKPSSQKEASSSSTPAKSASQGVSSTQASSASSPSSSSTSASASGTPSPSNASSTSTASSSSSVSSSTSEPRPSNEVLYLLAYIKYRGGIQNITPSDLIVDEYMIGTQKGTVLTMAPVAPIPFKLGLKGEEMQMLGDGEEENEVYRSYNIENLIGEYYSTPSQQSEVNSLLQEGQRHNVLDVLALMASPAWVSGESNSSFFMYNNYLSAENGGGQVIVKGNEVELGATIGLEAAEANGTRMHYHCYHFNAQSLLDTYYSTPEQKAQVNKYIGLGTQNGIPSWQQGFPS